MIARKGPVQARPVPGPPNPGHPIRATSNPGRLSSASRAGSCAMPGQRISNPWSRFDRGPLPAYVLIRSSRGRDIFHAL
jgi:hypothetical protein